ncbi:MAG: hypothetical protein JWQ98_3304 [Chlorobi bacterium]|nr:hypothetical protein [Chlorobiota bacterium]
MNSANNNAVPADDEGPADMILDIAGFLSRDPLSLDDVIERVGEAVADPGIPMPIALRPTLPGVRSASLTRYPDTGLPYLLTLVPSPDLHLTPRALAAVLGEYRRLAGDRGRNPGLIFYPGIGGARWSVAVIVEVERMGDEIDIAPVTSIAFRRDPVGG